VIVQHVNVVLLHDSLPATDWTDWVSTHINISILFFKTNWIFYVPRVKILIIINLLDNTWSSLLICIRSSIKIYFAWLSQIINTKWFSKPLKTIKKICNVCWQTIPNTNNMIAKNVWQSWCLAMSLLNIVHALTWYLFKLLAKIESE